MSQIIYQYDPQNGAYLGEDVARESPREPGVYLMPAGTTDLQPPVPGAGERIRFDGKAWLIEPIPTPPEPVPPAFSELVAAKLSDINAQCQSEIAAISSGYPPSEVLSWPKQESEARAFTAAATAATPLLDALASARGITKADLTSRVITKADMFAQISGAIIGKRQALEDQINALPVDATAADLDAIQW